MDYDPMDPDERRLAAMLLQAERQGSPDRELAPAGSRAPSWRGPHWYERLTPEEARRLADAINRA